jgi:hypothetical protein
VRRFSDDRVVKESKQQHDEPKLPTIHTEWGVVNEQAIDEALVGNRIRCAMLVFYEGIFSQLELARDTEAD